MGGIPVSETQKGPGQSQALEALGTQARIEVPEAAKQMIEELNEHGFEAYVVGGCVRDSLLGRIPEDWDITTSAKPFQVKAIFKRTIDTGIAHGTVTVMSGREGYEITTYRVDGEYLDGRHPKSVEFTASLLEDLKRRDFTINAMAFSHAEGLVDAFGGRQDLEDGIIRCVGDAKSRFTEDALRILRAIRFSAQLGFSIEEETKKAIRIIAPNMEKVSKERIAAELTKLLLSGHPENMALVYEYGISPYVSEAFCKTEYERGKGCLTGLALLPAKKALRWAGFLKYSGPEHSGQVMRDLKMDNASIRDVMLLTSLWQKEIPAQKPGIRKVMSSLSPDLYDGLLLMKRVFGGKEEQKQLEAVEALSREIRNDGDCVSLKDLAVTGKDLIAAGMKPGPSMGQALEKMLERVLEDPDCNEKQRLLEMLEKSII